MMNSSMIAQYLESFEARVNGNQSDGSNIDDAMYDNDDYSTSAGIDRNSTNCSFPMRLYAMLEDAPSKDFDDIISWLPDGSGFMVYRRTDFEEKVVGRYFRLTKYKSFNRQLNLYGFERDARGAYYHKSFIRGNFRLCKHLRRPSTNETSSFKQKLMAFSRKNRLPQTSTSSMTSEKPLLCSSNSNRIGSNQFFSHAHPNIWARGWGPEALGANCTSPDPITVPHLPNRSLFSEEDLMRLSNSRKKGSNQSSSHPYPNIWACISESQTLGETIILPEPMDPLSLHSSREMDPEVSSSIIDVFLPHLAQSDLIDFFDF